MKNLKEIWNLSALYKSDSDQNILKDRKKGIELNSNFVNKWEKRTDYLEKPDVLLEAIKDYESMLVNNGVLSNEDLYFFLRSSIDLENDNLKALNNKSHDLQIKLKNSINFFTHKLSLIPEKDQKKFLTYSPLSSYKHFLEKLFLQGKYLLSEKEEQLLLKVSKSATHNWVEMVNEFISSEQREVEIERSTSSQKVKKKKLSFDEILSVATMNRDEEIRDRATAILNEIFLKWVPVATKEINSILEYKRNVDELRGVDRPDRDRMISDDIDESFIDTLLESVTSNFSISKKWYRLKSKLLGKKRLKYNERLLLPSEIKKKFTFKFSKTLLLEMFKEYDQEMHEIVNNFFNEGRIDVYPRKGKSGGAFCTISLLRHPDYILLNHNNKIHDLTTLAHEFGHGVNHKLMSLNNSELNYTNSKATAEVASNFFEDMMIKRLEKTLNEREKLNLLVKKVDSDVGSIFRQIALYKFEQEIHTTGKEKGYISQQELGDIFLRHMRSYMGTGVSLDKGSENSWVYWSHIRYFFYVYSYASGQLISKSLHSLLEKDPNGKEKIKELLKSGGDRSPKNIFKDVGIDITSREFWDSGLKQIEKDIKKIEKLAKKLGKI